MTNDEATIINSALTDIGAGPMFSVDDDSELAEIVANVWPRTVKKAFGMHDWSFATLAKKSIRHAAAPENGYRYGFDLPGGRIGNPLIIRDGPRSRNVIRDFTIEGGKLYCDQPETWTVCKFYVDPTVWPPEWEAAFITLLGANLAVPVWQDADLRDDMLATALGTSSMQGTGGEFGRLMAQDKASKPVGEPLDDDNPLSEARYAWHGRF